MNGRPRASRPGSARRHLRDLAVFALLGPPIGAAVVFVPMILAVQDGLASGDRILADYAAIPIALGFLGYVAGLLPALATALAVFLLRPRVPSRARLVGLGSLTGAAASGVSLVWLASAAEPGLFALLAGLIVAAGATAGALCTALVS